MPSTIRAVTKALEFLPATELEPGLSMFVGNKRIMTPKELPG